MRVVTFALKKAAERIQQLVLIFIVVPCDVRLISRNALEFSHGRGAQAQSDPAETLLHTRVTHRDQDVTFAAFDGDVEKTHEPGIGLSEDAKSRANGNLIGVVNRQVLEVAGSVQGFAHTRFAFKKRASASAGAS